jgi:hypothetical protein
VSPSVRQRWIIKQEFVSDRQIQPISKLHIFYNTAKDGYLMVIRYVIATQVFGTDILDYGYQKCTSPSLRKIIKRGILYAYLHIVVCPLIGENLVGCLLFYIPLNNISLIWRRHHCRWRAAKLRSMLGAQSLGAGRGLHMPHLLRYGALVSHLKDLPPPFIRLIHVRHTRGCGESILTGILSPFHHQ